MTLPVEVVVLRLDAYHRVVRRSDTWWQVSPTFLNGFSLLGCRPWCFVNAARLFEIPCVGLNPLLGSDPF